MEIDLYYNSVYCGFQPLDTIMEIQHEYYEEACRRAKHIDWDEIMLYAIFSYNDEDQGFISADFMMIRLTYKRYKELCGKISRTCRVFFVRNS